MIKGKVVEIIDNRTIAINVGTLKSVKIGMNFQVLKDEGKEIRDPETKEVLGTIKLPKIKVRVTYAADKFSIAETYEYEEVNLGGINTLSNMSNLFSPPRYVKKYKSFDIEEDQRTKIEEEKSIVKIGDIVEQVIDEEENISKPKAKSLY